VRNHLMLIIRMNRANSKVLDYHLLPFYLVGGLTFQFRDESMPALAPYRLRSPSEFYPACRRWASLDVGAYLCGSSRRRIRSPRRAGNNRRKIRTMLDGN
jgi:hypothetical protein